MNRWSTSCKLSWKIMKIYHNYRVMTSHVKNEFCIWNYLFTVSLGHATLQQCSTKPNTLTCTAMNPINAVLFQMQKIILLSMYVIKNGTKTHNYNLGYL